MILMFRQIYGDIPKHNIHGKKYAETDEFQYFSSAKLKQVVMELSK